MADPATQPLFGETRRKDKFVNVVVATITALFVVVTVMLSLIVGLLYPAKCNLVPKSGGYCVYFMDIIFAAVIVLLLIPQVFVATWYKRGELEPKFRRMIYYNAVVTVLLCVTALLYFFDAGLSVHHKCPSNSTIHKAL